MNNEIQIVNDGKLKVEFNEKNKQEQINKLPENEKGISLEEKNKRIKERLDSEKIELLFKKIKNNNKYEFHRELPYYTKKDLLCFDLFKKYNKLLLSNYKLIYELRLLNEKKDEYFIGIINGLKHYRIYDLHIDCYDYDKDNWIKVFDISDMIKDICNKYSSIFGRLFDGNKTEVVHSYLSDFEVLVKKLNDGNKEFL